jgi:hypothetical protein
MTQLEALKEIARRGGGLLRPAAVVEAAKDEESPLHGAFEWDDGEAAQKYRLLQAQTLIRSFKVEIERNGQTHTVPVFIGISTDRTGEKSDNPYRLLEQVTKKPDLMKIAVQDALAQLDALRNKYAHLQELADVWAAVDKHTKRHKA